MLRLNHIGGGSVHSMYAEGMGAGFANCVLSKKAYAVKMTSICVQGGVKNG